jgi:D-alanyl-D-alanine carboxypeptidase/D-alanyl-D-alanine-endopeptidase (penicillin-binding protein 4)
MLRARWILLALLWFAGLAAGAGRAAAQPLPPEVAQALLQSQVPPEHLAVVVQELGAATPRLQAQADVPMQPASLFKLVTTTAALDLLGPAFSWPTQVWLDGPVRRGVLHGSLVIKGSGDPKLVVERLWLLLRRVRQLGVRGIDGDIVLDRTAFAAPAGSPADFDGQPLEPYNVQPDALLLNFKSVIFGFVPDPARKVARVTVEPGLAGMRFDDAVPLDGGPCGDWHAKLKASFDDPRRVRFAGRYPLDCGMREWPVAPPEPQHFDARLLDALWHETGGTLRGSVRDGAAPADTPPLFTLRSPPLAEVVRDINKYSNNVMAQQLFLTLGAVLRDSGTPEAARQVLTQWMGERFGAAAAGTVVDNGSGLSRDTRISARLLAQVLQAAYAGPAMSELMSSLPVSGTDGTARRMPGAPGRAHLKTGSLRDVAGIAGYVLGASGKRYLLVALINDPHAPAARAVLDTLVQWTGDDLTPPR